MGFRVYGVGLDLGLRDQAAEASWRHKAIMLRSGVAALALARARSLSLTTHTVHFALLQSNLKRWAQGQTHLGSTAPPGSSPLRLSGVYWLRSTLLHDMTVQ